MSAHGGNLKKRALLNKKNGSRTKTSTKFSYRVYCGFCGVRAHNVPNENIFTHVASGQHFFTCSLGHRGIVGGKSYSGTRPFEQENKAANEARA